MAVVNLGKEKKHPMLKKSVNEKDFKSPTDHELHKYYKENGGKLSLQKYKHIKKLIFLKLLDAVYYQGKRIDIPYFGEIFVQETKIPSKETNRKIVRNNHNISELMFQRHNHTRMPMNFYKVIELTTAYNDRLYDAYIKNTVQFRFPYKDKIQLAAIKAKKENKSVKFTNSYKKHPDYVYPDNN